MDLEETKGIKSLNPIAFRPRKHKRFPVMGLKDPNDCDTDILSIRGTLIPRSQPSLQPLSSFFPLISFPQIPETNAFEVESIRTGLSRLIIQIFILS
jgi:hypothetical protein